MRDPFLLGTIYKMAVGFIVPNFPALFLLLALSVLFSTINFLTDLKEDHRLNRKAVGYLLLWIGVNYIFALIFLLLIMPEEVSLGSFSRNLFVYCLIATALPELSANMRVQLGKQSEKALLDLRRYKEKVTGLISQQLERDAFQDQDRQLRNLLAYYTGSGRLQKFIKKLKSCMANCGHEMDKEKFPQEKEKLRQIIEVLEKGPAAGGDDEDLLINTFVQFSDLVPALLEKFKDDIEDFERSPVSRLMSQMHPLVTVEEAREMVRHRITSPRWFLWNTIFSFQRQRLLKKLKEGSEDFKEERIIEIRNVTRSAMRRRNSARIRWAFALLVIFSLAFLSFSSVGYKHQWANRMLVGKEMVLRPSTEDLQLLVRESTVLAPTKTSEPAAAAGDSPNPKGSDQTQQKEEKDK